MSFPFFLATKYLKPDRSCSTVVTFIAVLGVILGVAILIIVRAVMTGFGDMWREKILSFKPHIIVSSYNGIIEDDVTLCSEIGKISGVDGVSSSVEMRALAEHDGHVTAPIVVGIDPGSIVALHPDIEKNIVSGSLNLDENNAIIGTDLAYSLNLKVGDKAVVYSPASLVSEDEVFFPEEVTISAIYQMGHSEFDRGYVITSIGFARDLLGLARGGAYSIQIKTAKPQDVTAFWKVCESVRKLLPDNYFVRTWQEVDRELFTAIAVEKNMMVILLAFITIVAIFCVANTIIVITVRKTNEIGLLKALGFSSSRITAAFVLYGFIQCFVGTLCGVGLAYLVLNNLQGLIDCLATFGVEVFPKGVYGLDKIPWRIIPGEILQTIIFVIISCLVASILPAWRAAVKKPSEALRS